MRNTVRNCLVFYCFYNYDLLNKSFYNVELIDPFRKNYDDVITQFIGKLAQGSTVMLGRASNNDAEASCCHGYIKELVGACVNQYRVGLQTEQDYPESIHQLKLCKRQQPTPFLCLKISYLILNFKNVTLQE